MERACVELASVDPVETKTQLDPCSSSNSHWHRLRKRVAWWRRDASCGWTSHGRGVDGGGGCTGAVPILGGSLSEWKPFGIGLPVDGGAFLRTGLRPCSHRRIILTGSCMDIGQDKHGGSFLWSTSGGPRGIPL